VLCVLIQTRGGGKDSTSRRSSACFQYAPRPVQSPRHCRGTVHSPPPRAAGVGTLSGSAICPSAERPCGPCGGEGSRLERSECTEITDGARASTSPAEPRGRRVAPGTQARCGETVRERGRAEATPPEGCSNVVVTNEKTRCGRERVRTSTVTGHGGGGSPYTSRGHTRGDRRARSDPTAAVTLSSRAHVTFAQVSAAESPHTLNPQALV
jgi:hypothetical protein